MPHTGMLRGRTCRIVLVLPAVVLAACIGQPTPKAHATHTPTSTPCPAQSSAASLPAPSGTVTSQSGCPENASTPAATPTPTCAAVMAVKTGWSGAITVSYDQQLTTYPSGGAAQVLTIHRTANLSVRFDQWTSAFDANGAALRASVSGAANLHDVKVYNTQTTDTTGNAPPFYSQAQSPLDTHSMLAWHTTGCAYDLSLQVGVRATISYNGFSFTQPIGILAVEMGYLPSAGSPSLHGNMAVPAALNGAGDAIGKNVTLPIFWAGVVQSPQIQYAGTAAVAWTLAPIA